MSNDSSNGETEYRERLIEAKLNELAEHFESLRLFATFRGGPDKTSGYTTGRGNFHAQYGQVAEWIIRQQEYIREDAREEQRKEREE